MWCKFARDVVVFDSCASQTKCFRTCCPKPNPQVQGSSLRNISQVGTQIFIFNRFSFWIEVLKRSTIFRPWPKYLFSTWIILNKQMLHITSLVQVQSTHYLHKWTISTSSWPILLLPWCHDTIPQELWEIMLQHFPRLWDNMMPERLRGFKLMIMLQ